MAEKKTKTYNPKMYCSMLKAILEADKEAQQIKQEMIDDGCLDVSIETQIMEDAVYAKVSAA